MKTTRLVTLTFIVIFVLSLTPRAQAAINIVTVDDGGKNNVGLHTSLAVVNGHPAISYIDETKDNLLYVRAVDASGTVWGTPIVVDTANVRGQNKLLIVDGRPAIAYVDSVKDHIKYVRASDADGTAWSTPVPVDNSGNAGGYISAAIVNGKPAISYHDDTSENLMYAQAADAQGSSWHAPVIADDAEDTGDRPSLAVVDGRPAIAYYEYTNDDARYVRALDSDGANWGTPVTIDADGGDFFSLVVIDGQPAVAYRDWVIDALKYVRATDAQGTAWSTPLVLDSDGKTIGMFASLALVNGFPAIGYVENGSGQPELRYIRARDAAGNSWSDPMVVDSDYAGWYLSLAEVDCSGAISYYSSGSLKYAHGDSCETVLKNLSTRADVGTGADIAIAGFIIKGSEEKCVVVRGRGPSMNVSGVPLLNDPNLTLYSGQTIIDSNDDWMNQADPANQIIIENLGLAPTDFREAAIHKCLPEGPFTALLRGGNNTGVGIVEVFDADDGTSILENISTRARVGTGPLVTIAGFIIEGNSPKKILLRGRGPTVGVPDGVIRLSNPKLRLYQLLEDNSNVLLEENDNWGLATNAGDISASGQAPGDPNEAAILMMLDPGVYTGILDGVFGATGSGIIEVIDLTGN
jgi:hypothetical protein